MIHFPEEKGNFRFSRVKREIYGFPADSRISEEEQEFLSFPNGNENFCVTRGRGWFLIFLREKWNSYFS